MADFKGTKAASKVLGVKPATLLTAVWNGRIQEPERGPGGAFLWTDADIQRVAREFGVKANHRAVV